MRRSKSDPKKSVKNYRRVSQRRMTAHDGVDTSEEIKRLQKVIEESEAKLGKREHEEEEAPEQEEEEHNHYGNDDDFIILQPKKKKQKKAKRVELTPEEIKQAKQLHKNAVRKLKQLEQRQEQKKRRKDLYEKLEQNALEKETMDLLDSSKTLGKKITKKEQLKKLLQKERAGIQLDDEEKAILYKDRRTPNEDDYAHDTSTVEKTHKLETATLPLGKESTADCENDAEARESSRVQANQADTTKSVVSEAPKAEKIKSEPKAEVKSFASMMMASLSQLKTKTETQQESKEVEIDKMNGNDETAPTIPKKQYVPENPVILKTPAAMGLAPMSPLKRRQVKELKRSDSIQEVRSTLPVYGMEFEVMDAVRNNDVTIICGETGSGKSTQVPQFLYEAGLTSPSGVDNDFMIGVTLPRRVAAVSTAKRVCHEMGRGNGLSILGPKGAGNLVSYQTRYETAGLGSDTRLSFLTDGILLQEIQSDLLLRKYSAIVLDEAHERNLNTDVLIGLLSIALPLRAKAALEEGSNLVPLKVIIMSATLRVEDFTQNDRLFRNSSKAVVTIPGRTFPVTIHHSKVTELDDYEDLAVSKVCKIHRKLPQGGILLFLTGKQEIIRVVNRLRKALRHKSDSIESFQAGNDVANDGLGDIARDMDDDENDGDIFQAKDDFDEDEALEVDESRTTDPDLSTENENIPTRAIVLPLYSLMSTEDQARIFQPVSEGHRLIVVATNIAETSITIPGISYVVDTGRQKCRNYNSGTGLASYDIMWISKAAADQRAGRAGRTGPGHCYRLYSGNMYHRHMDSFALPEVLSRPLEDIILAMKAMNVANIRTFPFPTPPDESQIDSSLKLLATLGCIEVDERDYGVDGTITPLGAAVAKLPLGVRYGKILLVAAQSGLLDYALVIVAALSESNPFLLHGQQNRVDEEEDGDNSDSSSDEGQSGRKKSKGNVWAHKNGDIFASLSAVGAYTYAGKGAGGMAEKVACRKFCETNRLNHIVMERIQKLRKHLAKLAQKRLDNATGIAAKTGGISVSMKPPNKQQEILLLQSIVSGMLDHVAMLAPAGSISGDLPAGARCAYIGCTSRASASLYIDPNSVLFTRDFRRLPQWVCYDSMQRKIIKDGTAISVMKTISRIEPQWIGIVAKGSSLLELGTPIENPLPFFDRQRDAVLCHVKTKFGNHGWEIDPVKVDMQECMGEKANAKRGGFTTDDHFRWFARFLLEGRVILELKGFDDFLNDSPVVITRRVPVAKVEVLVRALSSKGICRAKTLVQHWAEVDDKLLFRELKDWIKADCVKDAKKQWKDAVAWNISSWKSEMGAK